MGDRPNEALILSALNMAIEHRAPKPGLIHHTDQGAIYRSQRYCEQMAKAGMLPSMGSKGSAYDNAVAESFFSNLKNELIHHTDFQSRESARTAIFSYIELFYNRQRIRNKTQPNNLLSKVVLSVWLKIIWLVIALVFSWSIRIGLVMVASGFSTQSLTIESKN